MQAKKKNHVAKAAEGKEEAEGEQGGGEGQGGASEYEDHISVLVDCTEDDLLVSIADEHKRPAIFSHLCVL